jgi:hypothetical protein
MREEEERVKRKKKLHPPVTKTFLKVAEFCLRGLKKLNGDDQVNAYMDPIDYGRDDGMDGLEGII